MTNSFRKRKLLNRVRRSDIILSSSEWFDVDYLEEKAEAYNTIDKEERDYKKRIDMAKRAKIATYKGVHLVEPQNKTLGIPFAK